MRTAGLVMAGGDGRRMRASGVAEPKPLVHLEGRPLLEHAIRWHAAAGMRDVLVALRADQQSILDFVRAFGSVHDGVRVEPLVEDRPMGNAGALLRCRASYDRVLLSFADNVSRLDGGALVAHHASHGAAATIAVHDVRVPFPYGVVTLEGTRVRGYDEKPAIQRSVSSGYAVFELAALDGLPPGDPLGLSDVVRFLLAAGHPIAAYRHEEAWADINDADRLSAARHVLDPTLAEHAAGARSGGATG